MTQWAFQSAAESLESKLFIRRTVSIIMIIFDYDFEDDEYDVCDQIMIGFEAHLKVGELLWGYEEPLLVGATMVLPPEEVKIVMMMRMIVRIS